MNTIACTCVVALTIGTAVVPPAAVAQSTPTIQVAPRSERIVRVQEERPRSIRLADANAFEPVRKQPPPNPAAAGGFCVVSLRDHQQWTPGEEKIQANFDGQSYRFSSHRVREIFAASPGRYAPVLKGDCPVTFAETGRRVAGSLSFGLLHQDRIYFFCGSTQLETFRNSPEQYSDVDLANQGICVVSEKLENKRIPGLPQTAKILEGLRYLFANAHQRSIFANNPAYFTITPPQGSPGNAPEHPSGSDRTLAPGPMLVPGGVDLSLDSAFDEFEANLVAKRQGNSSQVSESTPKALQPTKSYRGSEPPVMSGYCPVSIRKHGVWVRGKSNFYANYDDRVYFFAGPEELQEFQASPKSFNPVLSGDCIVTYRDENLRRLGSPFNSLVFQDRFYLFADQESKQRFRTQLPDYEHADLAFNGNCTVTQVQDNVEVTGLADLETQFRGKRYRFASQEHMNSFLDEPLAYEDP